MHERSLLPEHLNVRLKCVRKISELIHESIYCPSTIYMFCTNFVFLGDICDIKKFSLYPFLSHTNGRPSFKSYLGIILTVY